jgi:hypothetical protein
VEECVFVELVLHFTLLSTGPLNQLAQIPPEIINMHASFVLNNTLDRQNKSATNILTCFTNIQSFISM